ncbi:hypothetical protein M0R45_028236 [Rubus argutus]|uniref:Peptidase A1 domain-containing protein n=1 Tax=Rubus argutus TaxID=59490 RepID=A0AAW1W8R3_RUBAR
MSLVPFFLVIITVMFAIGGTPPPMAQAQSFTIKARVSNMSSLDHKLRQKLLTQISKTRVLDLDHGIINPHLPSGLFYVNAHIGTPPLSINLALDTFFPLTWVQSVDCQDCFSVSYPLSNFDPKKSTTFQPLPPNNSIICSPPIAHPSAAGSTCAYEAGYSRGIFGIDKFYLSPPSTGAAANLIAFGCGTRSFVDFDVGWDFNPIGGMLGLGKGHSSSIITQLGSDRFSYCLPGRSLSHPGQPTLDFGSDADASLHASATNNIQTTQIFFDEFNYLNMTTITLNGEIVYTMPETGAGAKLVFLDTGEPSTWLVEEPYFSLQDAVVRYFADKYGWKEPRPSFDPEKGGIAFDLCYDIPANLSSVVFPTVAMQFLGGASLELQDVFEIFPEFHAMCMVIREGAPNVVGVFQQMGYRFLFDLAQSKLSFAPNMC